MTAKKYGNCRVCNNEKVIDKDDVCENCELEGQYQEGMKHAN